MLIKQKLDKIEILWEINKNSSISNKKNNTINL